MEPWGSWGPCWLQDRPKVEKKVDFDPPLASPEGPFWEPFRHLSSLGRSWDLQMVVLGGDPFWHHFFDQILIKIGGLWETKNLDYTCEGLQKSRFRLCQIFYHFRYHFGGHFAVTTQPKFHCDSLWAPSVAIWTLFWGDGKTMENCCPRAGPEILSRVNL